MHPRQHRKCVQLNRVVRRKQTAIQNWLHRRMYCICIAYLCIDSAFLNTNEPYGLNVFYMCCDESSFLPILLFTLACRFATLCSGCSARVCCFRANCCEMVRQIFYMVCHFFHFVQTTRYLRRPKEPALGKGPEEKIKDSRSQQECVVVRITIASSFFPGFQRCDNTIRLYCHDFRPVRSCEATSQILQMPGTIVFR